MVVFINSGCVPAIAWVLSTFNLNKEEGSPFTFIYIPILSQGAFRTAGQQDIHR